MRSVQVGIMSLLSAGVLGCAGDDDAVSPTYRTTGGVCAYANAGNDGVTFSVGFSEPCLNPSVTSTQACSATTDGDRIDLTTSLERTGTTGASEYPTICVTRFAACNLTLPRAGRYLLVLDGGRSVSVALPSAEPVPLFGDRDCAHP